jgi:hypothetical protein
VSSSGVESVRPAIYSPPLAAPARLFSKRTDRIVSVSRGNRSPRRKRFKLEDRGYKRCVSLLLVTKSFYFWQKCSPNYDFFLLPPYLLTGRERVFSPTGTNDPLITKGGTSAPVPTPLVLVGNTNRE